MEIMRGNMFWSKFFLFYTLELKIKVTFLYSLFQEEQINLLIFDLTLHFPLRQFRYKIQYHEMI